MRWLRQAAAALLVAGASFAGSPAPAHADAFFTLPLAITPNPSYAGQIVKITVDFSATSCTLPAPNPPFEIYSVQTASPNSFPTQILGYQQIPTSGSRVMVMYTFAINVGLNRVSGRGHCAVVYGQPDAWLNTNEWHQTVLPRPAAPPATKSAPAQIKPTSPPPPVVFPTVHIQTYKLVPVLADFHTVAAVRQPSAPTVPGGGALAALVAAAVAAVMIGRVVRRRTRQHR
jgi:hypothetical protein